jgi:folate-binding protein YgfZ
MNASTDLVVQHQAFLSGAGLGDLTGRTQLELVGRDRVGFLHAFCTADIKRLPTGRGCEAFITNPQGKTLGHVLVFAAADRLRLDTSPGQAGTLAAHFDKYVISEDVQCLDRTADCAVLLLAGPQAPPLLARLAGAALPEVPLAEVELPLAGVTTLVRRVPYAGPDSYFLVLPRAAAAPLQAALIAAGATPCEGDAVDAARLDAGFPLFGLDITDDNLPQEVGRDPQAISFTKGCYLGQETVARIDAVGHVNRLLVGLALPGETPPAPGMPLVAGEREIGHVTSAGWSPRLGKSLAMAYVRRTHAAVGTRLTSPLGEATVVALPVGR